MSATALRRRLGKLRGEIRRGSDLLLAFRIGGWVAATSVMKHVVPLPVLVRAVRSRRPAVSRDRSRERQILLFTRWACRVLGSSRGHCLERSLVAYRYLGAAGANPRLVIGLGREQSVVRGHAWVEVDGRPIDETVESIAEFRPMAAFGRGGMRVPAKT